jgi:hypothetical protein
MTPSLHCPRCKQPFRIPQNKVGALLRCKRCDFHFRVAHEKTGGYIVRKDAAAPSSKPTMPASDSLRTNEDDTILGKPLPSANGPTGAAEDFNRTLPGKWIAPAKSAAAPKSANRPAPAAGGRPRGNVLGVALLAVVVLAGLAVLGFLFFPWKGNAAQPGGAAPVSLGKYGGVEIGSTGVKRVGVEYFQTPGGVREHLLDEPQDDNPKLADQLNAAGDFDDRVLQRTVDCVGDYFDGLKKLGVPPENIYIGCSSGVLLPFKNNDAALQRNRDRLVKAVRDATNRDPQFIDAHREARFAFEEIVASDERADSVLIDVGGGNIKGGGFLRKDDFKDFNVAAGVSSFEKKVAKAQRPDEQFVDAAARLSEAEIEKPLDAELKDLQPLLERKKVHFIGGLPWAMTTYMHPVEFYTPNANGSYYCRVPAEDLIQFGGLVRGKKPTEIRADVLAKTADQKKEVADAVAANVDKIQKEVFQKSDRLVGGAQILAALDKKFGVTAQNKEVWVFRYGHVAWLLRFVQEQSGHLTDARSPNS